MKTWMKILIWSGLSGGIGFFAGYRVGNSWNGPKKAGKGPESAREDMDIAEYAWRRDEAEKAWQTYSGQVAEETDNLPEGWENEKFSLPEEDETDTLQTVPKDIPQLHPQDMVPYAITEDEFNFNEQGYDIKCLDFYEGDEVLYDPENEEIIVMSEGLLGIGWQYHFGGDPNNPAEVIYIQNDTMGTLYRVELVHANFNEEVPGTIAPDDGDSYEEEDDEDEW